jgi:hypothetical protein
MDLLKVAMTAALFVAALTWAGDLTEPQNNAVRSTKQYLSMQGFSRNGSVSTSHRMQEMVTRLPMLSTVRRPSSVRLSNAGRWCTTAGTSQRRHEFLAFENLAQLLTIQSGAPFA